MPGPLEGIRVLNWSQFTPSSAGYILGDLGADVIKIEHPVQGDAYRGMGTMYGSAMSMKGGRHAGLEAVHRNQRSMTLNLKHAAGRGLPYTPLSRCHALSTTAHAHLSDPRQPAHPPPRRGWSVRRPSPRRGSRCRFRPRGPSSFR